MTRALALRGRIRHDVEIEGKSHLKLHVLEAADPGGFVFLGARNTKAASEGGFGIIKRAIGP
jgi:hypothetical protein